MPAVLTHCQYGLVRRDSVCRSDRVTSSLLFLKLLSQAYWWTFGRQRQEDSEVKASLSCIARPHLEKETNQKNQPTNQNHYKPQTELALHLPALPATYPTAGRLFLFYVCFFWGLAQDMLWLSEALEANLPGAHWWEHILFHFKTCAHQWYFILKT